MAQIQPITFPIIGTATNLLLRVLPFDMDATTADFYYELQDASSKMIINGNITMTESEFADWGSDNSYCLEWAAQKLGLVLV